MFSEKSAVLNLPNGECRGIIILIHGMQEDSSRYQVISQYFNRHHYGVVLFDLLGHGPHAQQLGVIDHHDGFRAIVQQVTTLIEEVKQQHPFTDIVLLGHSMGSLIARAIGVRCSDKICKIILSATPPPNLLASLGRALTNILIQIKGDCAYSSMIENLVFGKANKKFPNLSWLSVNENNVTNYKKNSMYGFRFTLGAYRDLFRFVIDLTKQHPPLVNPNVPIKIFVGSDDPIVGGQRGLDKTIKALKTQGFKNVSWQVYANLRHEIMNEEQRFNILNDMIEFLNQK